MTNVPDSITAAVSEDRVTPAAWFADELEKYNVDPEFRAEELSLEINEQLCHSMRQQGITRAELARRLGVNRASVTRLLNGSPNLTLLTLARVAIALDSRVGFTFVPNVEGQSAPAAIPSEGDNAPIGNLLNDAYLAAGAPESQLSQ